MWKLLPAVLSSLAFISYGALAADNASSDPVKPQIGAGPHLDRSAQGSGTGTSKDKTPPAVPPVKPSSPDGSSGASSGPSRPDTVQDQDDERKASEAKEKMKRKPGYQEEAPSPRASHTGLTFN